MSARLSDPQPYVDRPSVHAADPHASIERLERRIAALRAAGAARWDAPAFVYLTSLAARARRDRFDEHALQRALARCEMLEHWVDEMRATLEGLQPERDLPSAQVDAMLTTLARDWSPRTSDRAQGDRFRTSQTQLEASLIEARTAAVSARAHRAGDESSGPYNPTALAGKLLARLDALSPDYLRACLVALDDLSALQHLETEASSPKSRRPPPSRRGRE